MESGSERAFSFAVMAKTLEWPSYLSYTIQNGQAQSLTPGLVASPSINQSLDAMTGSGKSNFEPG